MTPNLTDAQREDILRLALGNLDDIADVVKVIGLASAIADARSALRAGRLDEAQCAIAKGFGIAKEAEPRWENPERTPGLIGHRCREVYNLLAKLHQ